MEIRSSFEKAHRSFPSLGGSAVRLSTIVAVSFWGIAAIAQTESKPPSLAHELQQAALQAGTIDSGTLPTANAPGQVPLSVGPGTMYNAVALGTAAFAPTTAFDAAGTGPCGEAANGIFRPGCFSSTGIGNNLVSQADAAFNAAVVYASSHNGATVDLGQSLWPVCNNQQGWILPHASGASGVNVAGASQVGSVLTLACTIARTALPPNSQSGSTISQAFLWEPVPAAFSLTSYHMHDFAVSANGRASACMDMEGTTYVSKFENLVCNGAAGDGTPTANGIRFGNSKYPNLSWSFQVFLDNISVTSGGNAGAGATFSVGLSNGIPALTVTAGGSGYSKNTEVFLNGTGAGSKPCTTMGTLTPAFTNGAITAVKTSGFAGCGGTVYAQAYDNVFGVQYGIFLDQYTDSTAISLQPQVGATAAMYIVGGNNHIEKAHPCCGMPIGAIDAGTNTWTATELDSVGSYGFSFGSTSASTLIGTQFYWNGSFPGSSSYLFGPYVGNVTLIAGKCNNLQSAGGYNQLVSATGQGAYPAGVSLLGEMDCGSGSPNTILGQSLSTPSVSGGPLASNGLQLKASSHNGAANTGNMVLYGANGAAAFTVIPNGDTYVGSYASAPARSLYFYQGLNGTATNAAQISADYGSLNFANPSGGFTYQTSYSAANAVGVQESGAPYRSAKWYFDGASGTGTGEWHISPLSSNVELGDASGAYAFNVKNSSGASVAGANSSGTFYETLQTPTTSSAICTTGQFADDRNYHYVCTQTNHWRRVALTDF